eukprot:763866-Hanusia_phi.AAC.3
MQGSLVEQQLGCLRRWMVSVIGEVCPSDLCELFDDSHCLVQLVEELDTGRVFPRLSHRSKEENIANFAAVIELMGSKGLAMNASVQGVVARDVGCLLQILWAVVELLVCIPQFSRYDGRDWREGAKKWANNVAKIYGMQSARVENFSTSFKDGVVLLVLVAAGNFPSPSPRVVDLSAAWPEAHVDVESTMRQGHQECIELALSLAEQKFHIPDLVSPQEIMEGIHPSCMLLYLACMHGGFAAMKAKVVVSADAKVAEERMLLQDDGGGDRRESGLLSRERHTPQGGGVRVHELLPTANGDAICVLCMQVNVRPRWLDCFHAFCLECLETAVESSAGSSRIRCPVCQFVSDIDIDELAAMDDEGSSKVRAGLFSSLSLRFLPGPFALRAGAHFALSRSWRFSRKNLRCVTTATRRSQACGTRPRPRPHPRPRPPPPRPPPPPPPPRPHPRPRPRPRHLPRPYPRHCCPSLTTLPPAPARPPRREHAAGARVVGRLSAHHPIPLQAGGKKPTERRRCCLHEDEEVMFDLI